MVQPNPFGAARPREQVIAERTGKKETDVLKEQAAKEWKPNVRAPAIMFCTVCNFQILLVGGMDILDTASDGGVRMK